MWLLALFQNMQKFWCKYIFCTRYKIFSLKGKHKFDENDAAMQNWTLRNLTAASVINLLYRLTLLHQRLREKFFHSIFLVTLGKKEAFQDQKPCTKVYPMAYSVTSAEYAMVYPHHCNLPWHIPSSKNQIYFAVKKLLRVLKFMRSSVSSVQSFFDSQMIGFSLIGSSLGSSMIHSSSDSVTLSVLNPCIHPKSE